MRTWTLFLFQDFQIHILGKDRNNSMENINTIVFFLEQLMLTCTRTKGQMSKAIEVTTEAEL